VKTVGADLCLLISDDWPVGLPRLYRSAAPGNTSRRCGRRRRLIPVPDPKIHSKLTLTGHCAVGRAAAVRTTEPGISRLRALDGGPGLGATWYDVFPGGCVQIALRPAAQQAGADVQIALGPATQQAGADQNVAGQVPAIIGHVSRAALQHDLAERSAGRLRLN